MNQIRITGELTPETMKTMNTWDASYSIGDNDKKPHRQECIQNSSLKKVPCEHTEWLKMDQTCIITPSTTEVQKFNICNMTKKQAKSVADTYLAISENNDLRVA
jgi:Cys-tRNA synthase (O-phospho-L-seryl-tRNA:Cys-tRNA synthase)